MAIEGTRERTEALATSLTSRSPELDREEIKRLAQQFEAILMTQMLREMRRAMVDEDEDSGDGFGAGPLLDTANVELGSALSRAGGLGLTDALLAAFERQMLGRVPDTDGTGQARRDATEAISGTLRNLPGAAVLPSTVPSPGPISSGFGWRQDPFTGESRFHKGVDLAIAYGRDVTAAAGGTVSFAGVQGGYGQTVVVDHAGGRQTRYAHLSEPLVRAGDVVAAGQLLGRSGSSGRATGPHLHFELLVDGRPVDPAGPAQ